MPVTMPVGDTLADRPLTRAVLIGLTDAVGVRPGPDAPLEPVATLERPGRRCDIYRHPATAERYVAVLRTSAAPGPLVLADGGYQCVSRERPRARRNTARGRPCSARPRPECARCCVPSPPAGVGAGTYDHSHTKEDHRT